MARRKEKTPEYFTVEVERLDQEGRGVGHHDGKVVVIEVDDRGKISLDRLDKPEAPARAEGASEGDGEHFQRRERPRRERSERSDRPRRPGDNGGRKPRRHHDAE